MMKSLALALSFLFSASVFAHGDHGSSPMTHLVFAQGAVHAHVTWPQGPQTPAESVMQLEWKDGSTHAPIEVPGSFKVSLFMPDMGHGSSPTQLERVLGPDGQPLKGVYRVTNVYFSMGGDWEVRVVLKPTTGPIETQTIKVHLEGGGHSH